MGRGLFLAGWPPGIPSRCRFLGIFLLFLLTWFHYFFCLKCFCHGTVFFWIGLNNIFRDNILWKKWIIVARLCWESFYFVVIVHQFCLFQCRKSIRIFGRLSLLYTLLYWKAPFNSKKKGLKSLVSRFSGLHLQKANFSDHIKWSLATKLCNQWLTSN